MLYTMVHYDQVRKGWFIPKGHPAVVWMDGPIKNRKTQEIVTTKDLFFENYWVHSSKECLVVRRFNETHELWFMYVMK